METFKPNAKSIDPSFGTLLHSCCFEYQFEKLKYLIDTFDIDVNIQDDLGRTVLHLCLEFQNYKGVKYLLKHCNVDGTQTNKVSYAFFFHELHLFF